MIAVEKSETLGVINHNNVQYVSRTFKSLGVGQTFYMWAKINPLGIGLNPHIAILDHNKAIYDGELDILSLKVGYTFKPFVKLDSYHAVEIIKFGQTLTRNQKVRINDVETNTLVHRHMRNIVFFLNQFYKYKDYNDLNTNEKFYGWFAPELFEGSDTKPKPYNLYGNMERFAIFIKHGMEYSHYANITNQTPHIAKHGLKQQSGILLNNVLVAIAK